MSTVRIPAKKTMEPGMSILDIDNIWDYIDMYVEEDSIVSETNVVMACLDEEYEDGSDDWDDCYDDSWNDYDGPYMEDSDWKSDYRDAFEDDPEAVWGRVW
jgi:hypothetical protein